MKVKRILGDIPIHIASGSCDFDNACQAAYTRAFSIFGIDEDFHSKTIDFVRSTDSVHIKFVTCEMVASYVGWELQYIFRAWVERAEEDKPEGEAL